MDSRKRSLLRLVALVMCLMSLAMATSVAAGRADDRSPAFPPSSHPAQRSGKPANGVVKPSELPWGGRTLLAGNRLVALYGTPGEPALGVLGEQPLDASLQRARELAASYQPHTQDRVIPTLEIIASVASSSPTANGDYSAEIDADRLRPWVEAAGKAGMYVVLDLQPGRSDFLIQAKAYESLLKLPHVGLALDPEWRVNADQVPLGVIGSVGIDEVNATAGWLAGLVKAGKLPQKLFLVHQFRLDMVRDRERLDMAHGEQLAYMIQMDGHGSQAQKSDTWNVLRTGAPAGISFGWKNFYDEDSPMLTPQQTVMLSPSPAYVSYQ